MNLPANTVMSYKPLNYRRTVQVGSKTVPMVQAREDVTVQSRKGAYPLPWKNSGQQAFGTNRLGPNTTLSNNNRTMQAINGSAAFGANPKTTGKWYAEFGINSNVGYSQLIGIANSLTGSSQPWTTAGELLLYESGGSVVIWGANIRQSAAISFKLGDRVGFAVDLDAGTLQYYVNGVAMGVLYALKNYITSYAKGQQFWTCVADPYWPGNSTITDYPETPLYVPAGYDVW